MSIPHTEPPVVAVAVSPRPTHTPGKVLAPAIALLCVAGFNGLFALVELKDLALGRSKEEERQLEKIANDESAPELVRNAVRRMTNGAAGKWIGTFVALVFSAGIAAGGIMMLRMRMYPLALTGAILSLIPCATLMGCCGVGQAVGIWAILVLANQEVRGWFS